MKKELFVAIFFLSLLTAALINIHYLRRLTEDVTASIDAAVQSAEAGNWTEAVKKAEEAVARWRGSDAHTHLVLRHSEIEAATDALYNLAEQVYAQNAGAAKGAGQAAAARLDSIYNIERVRPGSIF